MASDNLIIKSRAQPITFNACAGWLHDASGTTGILLCSPWGLEELCMRRAWAMLAGALCDAGYPTLRFDYPCTGDSLGDLSDLHDVQPLIDSIVEAAAALRRLTGVTDIVLIGQGLGALLATKAADAVSAGGLVAMAPTLRGKDYLRELTLWGAVIEQDLGYPGIRGEVPASVGGFDPLPALVQSISELDLSALEQAPAPRVLVVARQGRASDGKVIKCLSSMGVAVEDTAYDGYDGAVGNPSAALPPVGTIGKIVGWMQRSFPAEARNSQGRPLSDAVLNGADFAETLVRTANNPSVPGILCEPAGTRRGATVLILNAGGNPHAGWARANVDYARRLAAEGIASLRIDVSDVGDNVRTFSVGTPCYYDEVQLHDVLSTVDWLHARDLGPVIVMGSCSGAYMALQAALSADQVNDIILVNQRRFLAGAEGDIESASNGIMYYRKRAANPLKLLARLISGDINLKAAGGKLISSVATLITGNKTQLEKGLHKAFHSLADRKVRVSIFQSTGTAHHPLVKYAWGRKLRRRAGFTISETQADHTMTPRHARDVLFALMLERATHPRQDFVFWSAESRGQGPTEHPNLAVWTGIQQGAASPQ